VEEKFDMLKRQEDERLGEIQRKKKAMEREAAQMLQQMEELNERNFREQERLKQLKQAAPQVGLVADPAVAIEEASGAETPALDEIEVRFNKLKNPGNIVQKLGREAEEKVVELREQAKEQAKKIVEDLGGRARDVAADAVNKMGKRVGSLIAVAGGVKIRAVFSVFRKKD
jgi:biopolymer transport protein ExbB/TolQ